MQHYCEMPFFLSSICKIRQFQDILPKYLNKYDLNSSALGPHIKLTGYGFVFKKSFQKKYINI